MKRRTCAHDHVLCIEALTTGPSVAPKCTCDKKGMIKVWMAASISITACLISQCESVLGEHVPVLSVCLTHCNHECFHGNAFYRLLLEHKKWFQCSFSPATKHVRHILLQPSQLKVLQVAPLTILLSYDHSIPLLLTKIDSFILTVWIEAQVLQHTHKC